MRKLNAILTACILILLLVHGIAGGFQVMGVLPGGNQALTVLAWIMMALLILHMVISLKFTGDTLRAMKASGTSYFKENKLFWARRVSGLAVLILVIFHILLFMGKGSGTAYRLNYFGTLQLVGQILLVAALAVHVLCNIRPLFLSFGTGKTREYLKDLVLVLGIILLFTGAALVIYYLRWNVFWRYG